MGKLSNVSKAELEDLYWVQGKSLTEIASEVGCSDYVLWLRFQELGVPRRPGTSYRTAYKKVLLTKDQEQLIIGGMLGDCACERSLGPGNPRIYFSHTKENWKYLFWKYRLLAPSGLIKTSPVIYWAKDQTGKEFPQLRFVTISHPVIKPYAKAFYPEGKRVVPKEVLATLRPLGLGVWFGDDGSLSQDRHSLYLSTESYSWEENELIRAWLAKEYKAEFRVYPKRTQGNLPVLMLYGEEAVGSFLAKLMPLPPSKNLRR